MNVLSLISGIFKPAAALIDNLHTSEEEKMQVKQAMFELQVSAFSKAEEYEQELLKAKASIINAEATGQSWLQRNWRPLTMVWFNVLLGMYWFGLTPDGITEATINKLFTLLQIGIGGYIAGRSVEKVVPKIAEVFKKT